MQRKESYEEILERAKTLNLEEIAALKVLSLPEMRGNDGQAVVFLTPGLLDLKRLADKSFVDRLKCYILTHLDSVARNEYKIVLFATGLSMNVSLFQFLFKDVRVGVVVGADASADASAAAAAAVSAAAAAAAAAVLAASSAAAAAAVLAGFGAGWLLLLLLPPVLPVLLRLPPVLLPCRTSRSLPLRVDDVFWRRTQVYSILPRPYKKNIKALYILHPSDTMKFVVRIILVVVSNKFWKKVCAQRSSLGLRQRPKETTACRPACAGRPSPRRASPCPHAHHLD
jgi:hypothetical protein